MRNTLAALLTCTVLAACNSDGSDPIPQGEIVEGEITSSSTLVVYDVAAELGITCQIRGGGNWQSIPFRTGRLDTPDPDAPESAHCTRLYHEIETPQTVRGAYSLYLRNGPIGSQYRASLQP